MQTADISLQMVCAELRCCYVIMKLHTDFYLRHTKLAYLRVASESVATECTSISLWGAVLSVKMGAGS